MAKPLVLPNLHLYLKGQATCITKFTPIFKGPSHLYYQIYTCIYGQATCITKFTPVFYGQAICINKFTPVFLQGKSVPLAQL